MNEWVQSLAIPWQFVIYIVCLCIGVFCLVRFSDIFVDSASAIAKKLHISPLIIGLTIVAIGTSCPELAVSTSDSITALINGGNANVAIGNVIGSNICNLLIVLGISCLFHPIFVKKSVCKREFPFLLIVSMLCVVFVLFFGIKQAVDFTSPAITRWEGIILAVLIVVYIFFLVFNAKRDKAKGIEEESEAEEVKDMPLWKAILFVILGAAGIVVGGEAVVFGAKGIALDVTTLAGVDKDLAESLIGLTVVAVGTSLPELVTSAVAAKKGQNELALGNVIGSNIFNIVFVLGIAATVNPLVGVSDCIVDVIIMMAITILVFLMALFGKFERKHGIILLCVYGCYLTYLIIRTFLSRDTTSVAVLSSLGQFAYLF